MIGVTSFGCSRLRKKAGAQPDVPIATLSYLPGQTWVPATFLFILGSVPYGQINMGSLPVGLEGIARPRFHHPKALSS